MKKDLIVLFLILFSGSVTAQLQVDAGKDTILCVGLLGADTTELGGNPTATGGVEPYVYAWSAKYTLGSSSYWASYFLDDSTKSNPKLIHDVQSNLKFKVVVTDNNETHAEDSVTVRFSWFGYLASDCIAFIEQGDTVKLFGNMGLGIEPLSFFWSPDYNISDTSSGSPLAWPDTSTHYTVYAVDSIGCISGTSGCWISVNTTGTNSNYYDLTGSSVFPNPITSNSTISLNTMGADNLHIAVINAGGQVVFNDRFAVTPYLIGDKALKKGNYIYVIQNASGIVSYGKFVKE
jgi:hypothetical protein